MKAIPKHQWPVIYVALHGLCLMPAFAFLFSTTCVRAALAVPVGVALAPALLIRRIRDDRTRRACWIGLVVVAVPTVALCLWYGCLEYVYCGKFG